MKWGELEWKGSATGGGEETRGQLEVPPPSTTLQSSRGEEGGNSPAGGAWGGRRMDGGRV